MISFCLLFFHPYLSYRQLGVHVGAHVDAILDVVVGVGRVGHRYAFADAMFWVTGYHIGDPADVAQVVPRHRVQVHEEELQADKLALHVRLDAPALF